MPRKDQAPRVRSNTDETAPKQPVDKLMQELQTLTKQPKGARINVSLIPGKLEVMHIRVAIRDLGTFSSASLTLEVQTDGTINVIKM